VLSVHSIVSFDFAVSQVPGWHTTIFPPYFVAGADLQRLRHGDDADDHRAQGVRLQHLITLQPPREHEQDHLLTGTMVGYAYAMEFFIAWYGGNPYERSPSSTAPSAPTPGPTGSWSAAT
jgi:hypothetical protein